MNQPAQPWSPLQLEASLNQIDQYITHPCFEPHAAFTHLTQSIVSKLIVLESALLEQVQQRAQRVDFMEEVGTSGRIEDITSLLSHMAQSLHEVEAAKPVDDSITILRPDINHFYGAGVGYFANGLFFTCPYEDELTFFVDRNRVFFHRHLVRAFDQAKAYLRQG